MESVVELPFCKCGECGLRVTKPGNLFIQGHTGGRKKFPREIRICECGCGNIFECRVDSNKRYYSYGCYWKDPKDKVSLLKGRIWEEYFGKERADELKQNLRGYVLGKTGSKAPNWQGGISFLPYSFEFNTRFRQFIRERDNDTCQLCGRTKEQEGRTLCVHHIGYDKENDCSDEFDFITLCRVCNSAVNVNREYWTEFFQLMQERRFCLIGVG